MGLDMYLHAKRYLWSYRDESEDIRLLLLKFKRLPRFPKALKFRKL